MAVTVSSLDGFFKRRYGQALEKVLPSCSDLAQDIKFSKQDKLGDSYNVPVRLRRGTGWTWAGSGVAGTAYTLNGANSGLTKNASISASSFVGQEQIAYDTISRAGDSEQAFGAAFDEIVSDQTDSASFAREMAILYGGSSIGTIESLSGSGTTRDWVISKATWAPALFLQLEGASLDVYTASSGLPGTKLNANAVVVVTAVNVDTRTLSVSGNATDLTAIVVNSLIVPVGAKGNWMSGIDVIVTNTGSLFGIDAATYGQWKGNSYSAGSAALTLGKVLSAAAKTVVRGHMGDLTCYLSTYSWTDLSVDHSALRVLGPEAVGEVKLGTDKITYRGPNGNITLKSHPMVKAGEAFMLSTKHFMRVGSTDLTFKLPDAGDERFFRQLDSQAGIELRCYWDQALFTRAPHRHVKITGIVNNSL